MRMPLRTMVALTCWALVLIACGQHRFVAAGDKAYAALAYAKAVDNYERAAEAAVPDSGYASKLARSYLNLRDFKHAETWFARATAQPQATAKDQYDYAQVLRANGKFGEADKWLRTYELKNVADSRAKRQANASTYGERLRTSTVQGCEVRNVPFNTPGADMGAAYFGKGTIAFASDRAPGVHEMRRHTWNGKPFLDLFTISVDTTTGVATPLDELNTRYHESNAVLSPDGKTVWFTRNNFHQGKKGKNGQGVVNLKIYSRTLSDGKWVDEQPFPFNSDEWSVGHPSISADGNTLYFTSDKPGGVGGTDIWRSVRNGNTWSTPACLDAEVNTEGNEMFPFIAVDGTLAFASDGQAGLGGLDILVGKSRADGSVSGVKNPGAPLNSSGDDFGLVLDGTAMKGYFTSDRTGGKGGDDIYAISFTRALGSSMRVRGTAMDLENRQLLQGVKVRMQDQGGDVLAETTTDINGDYAFELEPEHVYYVVSEDGLYRVQSSALRTTVDIDTIIRRDLGLARKLDVGLWMHVTHANTNEVLEGVKCEVIDARAGTAVLSGTTDATGDLRNDLQGKAWGDTIAFRVRLEKSGFFPKRGLFTYTLNKDGEVAMHETLDLNLDPIEVGADVGTAISINPIYFDLGKASIRPDAAVELDKIVTVMNENPNVEIELGSHTDSRGSDRENRTLSDKRAKSSAAYIVSKGIMKDRIKSKGYGESRLLNTCVNGAKCSEEEHQMNRRTEFIITKM